MRTPSQIRTDLIAAHRAGEWDLARQLSQEKQRARKQHRYCIVCGLAVNPGSARCMLHALARRFYHRALAAAAMLLACVALAGDQSVTLAWNRNPETNILHYVIYYGPLPRFYTGGTNVGNVVRGTVRGLDSGTNWYFALTAVNAQGLESDYSEEVSTAIPPRPVTPVVLTNWWNVPPLRLIIMQQPIMQP